MKPIGQPAADQQPESIEFVPKRHLDRAQREIDRLRKENERLQQEAERLRRELEVALRASKRQAAPHSRGNPKANPRRPVQLAQQTRRFLAAGKNDAAVSGGL